MAAAYTSPLSGQAPSAQPGRCHQEFPGHERELAAMRRWLKSVLPACPARDDVVSVATELGANAVQHTASGLGGRFAVEVIWRRGVVRVAVADQGAPYGPRIVEDSSGESGQGLLLVRGMSLRVGARGDERGRVVWADLPWESPLPGQPPEREADAGDGAAALAHQFGVPVWIGQFTGQWWALARDDLVSAPTAPELAALLARLLAPLPRPPGSRDRREPGPRTGMTTDWAGWAGGPQH